MLPTNSLRLPFPAPCHLLHTPINPLTPPTKNISGNPFANTPLTTTLLPNINPNLLLLQHPSSLAAPSSNSTVPTRLTLFNSTI